MIRAVGRIVSNRLLSACLLAGLAVGLASCTGSGDGPVLPARELLVANLGGNSVVGFELDASGQVQTPPFRIIRGPSTDLHNPMDVDVPRSDEIFVVNLGDASSGGPSVTIFDPAADGDTAPDRVLQGAASGLSKPNAVTAGQWQGFLVTNHVDPPGSSPFLGVIEYRVNTRRPEPTGGIFGANTTISGPMGIARDLQNRVFFAEPVADRILGFAATAKVQNDQAPDFVISGPSTLLEQPMGVDFDGVGNMYVVNRGNPSITVYAPNPSGDAPAIRRIGGPGTSRTMLYQPDAILVDDAGRIYVSQTNTILVFAPGANGDAAPVQRVQDPSLSATMGLALRD